MIMYWSVMDGKEGTTPRSDGWPMTSRSDAQPMTSRYDRGKMEPERASVEYMDMVQDLGQHNQVMVDSYLSRLDSVTRSDDEGPREITHVQKFDTSGLDTDRKGEDSVRNVKRKWPAYLTPPNGLRIITWDEFIEVPDMLNGQFSLDKNGYISHDPSTVNVFFHDARIMQANLGSLSQSGKAWTVFVQDYQELKSVRNWLTERISVLVVTLHNKHHSQENNLGATACCLLAVDPSFTSIREKIHEAMSQAMESFLEQRQFCVILDFNSSVERWCQDVLHMRCEALGAKIIITNGDEPLDPNGADSNICCHYFCMPFKYIQGRVYQVQRRASYDDYDVTFEQEHILLCTANSKLQAYAEKAQTPAPMSSRRVTRKRNTITFTEGTQTAGDVQEPTQVANGDCGVIDLEDMERGGEEENMQSSREVTVYDRVIKDKDRAGLMKQNGIKTRDPAPIPTKRLTDYKLKSHVKPKEIYKKQAEGASRQREPSVEEMVESQSEQMEYPSPYTSDAVDVKAEVHQPNYKLEYPGISDELQISYNKTSSDADAVKTIVEPCEEVRTSIQTLKLDNYVPDPQFSIDVFDTSPIQAVTEQPVSRSSKSNAKQQKRINKMLMDIMGPGPDTTKKHSKKEKPGNGVINPGFQDENGVSVYDNTDSHRPRTAEPPSFQRREGYGTLPLTKVNGGRSTSKSADFEEDHMRYDIPISPKKVKRIKQKFMEKDEKKLFTPRLILEKDRNCFSDIDPVDEFTDIDAPAASDNEGLASSRVINVRNTEKTISMDSVRVLTDTELEITDCDTEDMSVTSENSTAHARKRTQKPAKRPDRGQKGQYDSRRRYLALNSLRRKTKARMLNAEIRNRARVGKS